MSTLKDLVAAHPRLLMRQIKEWGEILLGFEAANRYEIEDERGGRVGYAAEESGGIGAFFARSFMGRCRAATIHVYDGAGRQVGRGVKPFRWYYHRMEAFDGDRLLGAIERRFALLRVEFAVLDAAGREILTIERGALSLWKFRVLKAGREVGLISKQWAGLLKEMFSDADRFGFEVSGELSPDERALLFVATFLVDFACFENNQSRG